MDHAPLLAGWESYYVIIGSSAGALTGLQFVVMALIAESPARKSADTLAAFGTPTVVHFCLALLMSAVLSAPWPAVQMTRYPLLASGIGGAIYTLLVMRRAMRQAAYKPVAEDWVWHVVFPLSAYLVVCVGGARLAGPATVPLFAIAGAAMLLVFVGIHNAWDSIQFVALQREPGGADGA
jgi:hypothetical protein